MTKDEMVREHRRLTDMNLSKLQEIMKEQEAWHIVVHGVLKSWICLSDRTATTNPPCAGQEMTEYS